MNLQKLFEMQAVLDADILKRHPVQPGEDRLSKKILALLVELGECANEWRGFKFWSNRQTPGEPEYNWKPSKDGESLIAEPNDYKSYPLLEEYVDCLHFILSIGNELGFREDEFREMKWSFDEIQTVERLFSLTIVHASFLAYEEGVKSHQLTELYETLNMFINLGCALGFTWEQIEQAYYSKNQINFERQATGY